MNNDYNPQLGYKRTLFGPEQDFLTGLKAYEICEDGLQLTALPHGGREALVKVSFLTDTVFRLQMFPEMEPQIPRNPVFLPEAKAEAELSEQERELVYGTGAVQLHFQKDYWEMSVYGGGKRMTREQVFDTNVDNRWKTLPIGYSLDEQGRCTGVRETMYLYSDEAFWGFGEKFTDLNKRGQYLHCWQKDAPSSI